MGEDCRSDQAGDEEESRVQSDEAPTYALRSIYSEIRNRAPPWVRESIDLDDDLVSEAGPVKATAPALHWCRSGAVLVGPPVRIELTTFSLRVRCSTN